jgi:small-conductance mechanosensitive channel
MIRKTVLFVVALAVFLLLLLPLACGGEPAEEASAPEPTSPSAGADTAVGAETPAPTSVPEGETAAAEPTSPPEDEAESTPSGQETAEEAAEAVAERTPLPTPVPGPIEELVTDFTVATGLAGKSFLGLTVDDWINLGISALIFVAGYQLGHRAMRWLLRRIVRRTPTEFDDEFLEAAERELKWFVGLIFLWFATFRLGFLSDGLRTLLNDLYFTAGLAICTLLVLKLVDFGIDWYRDHLEEEDKDRLNPLIMVLQRMARIVVLLFVALLFFQHFGINITVVAGALGIGGLALSLAAQDTLSDVIAGFTILLDRPFRVGDRIEISDLGTWGDVVEIGTRTTRIRTRDNRMVIVPNSTIGKSQVVNYTFPDPTYRIQMDIGIGYGQDIERVRQIVVDTVRDVPGVLPNRPVDALYNEMGESSMTFRVRWWIQSYEDTRRFYDRVNTALQNALDQAGVDMPFTTYDINVKMDEENVGRISEAFREDSPTSTRDGQ